MKYQLYILALILLGLTNQEVIPDNLEEVQRRVFSPFKRVCQSNTPCAFAYYKTDEDRGGAKILKIFDTWCRCEDNQVCSFNMITPTNIYRYTCNDG